MGANDLNVQYDKTGKALVVELIIEKAIADWWLRHVSGQQTIQTWSGRTDDPQADVAAINLATLTPTSSLNWLILLYGPNADMNFQVTIDVRQGDTLLGSKTIDVSIPAKTAKQEAGSIFLTARPTASGGTT